MRLAVTMVALASLVACRDAPARVGQEATPTPTPTPRGTLLTCGVPKDAFPPSALDAPADAEKASGAASDALRAWLADPDNEQFAKGGGWRALVATDSDAVFAQGTPPGITVRFERRAGAWKWANSAGRCDLRVLPPPGLGAGEWQPATAVRPADTAFVANVWERSCSGGKPPEGRVAPPEIEYTATTVVVTFFVRPRGGSQTCQGAPSTPYDVVLREPLGARKLLDGGTYPPRVPRSPYAGG